MTADINKPRGLTKDTGWQIGVRRTVLIPAEILWEFMLSPQGLRIWLGDGGEFMFKEGSSYTLKDGTSGKIKVYKPGSHWRITRKPPDKSYERPSTIQVRILDQQDRSVLAFHEEHLPDEKARLARKTYYLKVIDQIADQLAED